MEQDEFQVEFQRRLQAQLGKLLFDNTGQQLRIEVMAQEAALMQHEINTLKPAVPVAEESPK